MNRAELLQALTKAELAAFERFYQDRANRLQSEAAQAQREADAARKELKRRKE